MPLRGIRSSQSSLIAGALIRAGMDVIAAEIPSETIQSKGIPRRQDYMMYGPPRIDAPQSSGPIKYGKPSRDQKLYRKSGGSQNHCGCGKPISANKDQCFACKQAKGGA